MRFPISMRLHFSVFPWVALLASTFSVHAGFVPTHQDSGWVRLFNGKDLTGLHPWIEGSALGQNPGNIVSVHDSMIHFYAGRKRADKPASPSGVLSTDLEFGQYQARVEFKPGDFAGDGWLTGDPWNSGLFFHADAGAPPFPQAIECQLKIHWNSKANKPCTVAAGDCDQRWTGDAWILSGAQIINKDGAATPLGGCCQSAFGNHQPDYELEGWNTMEVQVFGDSLFRNLLNGHEVNRGTKSTYLNRQNQRVPLKKGRLQLELEGSEFLFRNWEIKLSKGDSLYSIWYQEGCRDPAYQEYSPTTNLHVQKLCVNLASVNLVQGELRFFEARNYDIRIFDVGGHEVSRHRHFGPGGLKAAAGLKTGVYFLQVQDGKRQWTKSLFKE